MEKVALLTEDNADLQMVFSMALEHSGFKVVVANDGCEALQYLEHAVPDVFILDLHMPNCSGQDVLERLKEWGKLDQVYTVVVTGDALAGRYLNTDLADIVLIKPVSPVDLAQIAKRIAHRNRRLPIKTGLRPHKATAPGGASHAAP